MKKTNNSSKKVTEFITKFSSRKRFLPLRKDKPGKLAWTFLLIISTLLFVSHTYNDIVFTTRNGINLINLLFEGKILSFFSYNANIVSGNIYFPAIQSAIYNFLLYVVFAIWNFPLWILEKFLHVDVMNNIYCLLWSKTMVLFFLSASAIVLRKICIELKLSEKSIKWSVFYYLSSALVLSSTLIMSQYDVISITIILLGFLMYLRGDMKKFVLYFMVAITLKYFALFVFIPLVLLKEKRIMKILQYVISGFSLTILINFIFSFDKSTQTSTNFLLEMLKKFMANSLQLSVGQTSWFYLLIILLFVFCYYKVISTTEELNKFSVYVSFLSFAILFGFTSSYPYWVIFIVPFIILLVLQNPKNMEFNMIIEIVMSTVLIFSHMIVFPHCFSDYTFAPMVLPKLFVKLSDIPKLLTTESLRNYPNLFDFVNQQILPILIAAFIGMLLTLAFVNFPKFELNKKNSKEINPKIVLVRLLINGTICLLPILAYFISIAYKYIKM